MKLRKITQNSELSTYEWEQLIDKWIFSERDRYIMKRALLDEASYETISEEVGLSVRHTKTIASTSLKRILANINSSLKQHLYSPRTSLSGGLFLINIK